MEKKGTFKIEKAGKEGKSGGNMFGVSAGRTVPATEKVSVNMNIATLAQIDLLVDQGHYSNRSDFINEAVRQSLGQKQEILNRIIPQQELAENNWFLGIYSLEREKLECAQQTGNKIRIRGYGLLILSEELDDLIEKNVSQIRVRGKVSCSERIRKIFGL